MKKYLVFIFTLFYFTAASGTTLEFHYCMGNLVDWGMSKPSESKTCSNCKMSEEEAKDCCKKDQHDVKIEQAQKAQFSYQFKQIPSLVPQHFVGQSGVIIAQQKLDTDNFSHAPPRTEKIPVFLQLRTFRI
ncbi:hypothetical protein GZH53_03030 [Flavihumibacter sp. R14]|nr:hypothetical protein [Flavihumibacter soli]